jgi:hypothetical protein
MDDWYCHNICNYSKHDEWNNNIFKRNFPDNILPPILDPRPDIKFCGKTYIVQPNGINLKDTNMKTSNPELYVKKNDMNINLNIYRKDADCYFCRFLNNLSPNRGDALHYLKIIDIDSYLRLLHQNNTLCNYDKTSPMCFNLFNCDKCNRLKHTDPDIVSVIDRWNYESTNTIKPYYYNNCPKKPIELIFNNNTKNLYNYIRL